MIYNLTKERAKEILDLYHNKKKNDLFNWCNEYKQFISECVSCCVSSEWDYMLKQSYEDSESPVSYEDLDEQKYKQITEEDIKEQLSYMDLTEEEINEAIEEENGKYQEAQDQILENIEIYEWWIIQDPLKYRLEKQGEIFLNDAWGRQATGQSISLDYCCIKAFLSLLEDLI